MKIRIKGNSVRYRLTKSEVAMLAESGKLEDKTEFISGTMIYAIEQTDDAQLSADFNQHQLTLYIPGAMIRSWAETEQVGIARHMPLANGNSLHLLLEKDFKCIDADVSEDQSDYFENPQTTC